MTISQIGESVGDSVTLKLNATAAALRAKGEPVIHLGGGEPKSKAPPDAIAAAVALLNTGEIRYTPTSGIPALKDAIIRYTEEYYHRRVGREHVMAAGGAKQAIMVCLQAVLDPGDELVFPVPYWVSYPDMARLCGAIPVPAPCADGTFYPRLSDIERVITSRTKVVMINSPNNPTGAMYSEEFIAGIVEFCERRGLYLIMDDIYHRLIFDGKKPISCYTHAKAPLDSSRLVVVNGVSKQYAMTGFRLGWSVANPKLTGVMTRIQSHQTSGPSVVSQQAAIGAIHGDQGGVESLRQTLESNRNHLVDRLARFPGVRAPKPDGAFYCFADFRHYDEDSTRLAARLLEKVLVVTVPGVEFGLEGYLRLSTCGGLNDILEGVDRIQWALDPAAPRELQLGERKLIRDW